MAKVLFLALLALPVSNSELAPALNAAIVNAVNSNPEATWTAEMSPRFQGRTRDHAESLCGAWTKEHHPSGTEIIEPPLLPKRERIQELPTDFDGRTGFPGCNATIGHVRDQTDCGACWAFSATEAFNDRRCIALNDTTLLSVQDTASCCSGSACQYSNGCVGGQPASAWNWFTSVGVVTGGDYSDSNETDTCLPFSLQPCTHNTSHVKPDFPLCPHGEYTIPSCKAVCSNTGYKTPYPQDKQMVKGTTFKINHYPPSVLQTELSTHGPVSTIFTVYDDFIHYKSGVYRHLEGSQVGSHAIVITGWGVEGGVPYWWVKNSWGSDWGLGGFVKVGHGECGIENSLVAGYVVANEDVRAYI